VKVIDCKQGTPEWKAARCGRVTASRIAEMMATLKSGAESAGRRNYRAQLVAEILSGEPQDDGYINAEMQWGIDHEEEARSAYEAEMSIFVERVGIVVHPDLDWSSCSPDGLIGENGMCQIKCPKTAAHLKWIIDDKVPQEHVLQMQWEMACTGRQWSDFVSFDPRLEPKYRLFVKRLPVSSITALQIQAEAATFWAEVQAMVKKLRELRA
jgi:putative phage-type endonuclease